MLLKNEEVGWDDRSKSKETRARRPPLIVIYVSRYLGRWHFTFEVSHTEAGTVVSTCANS
jgi:hypothetical protein